MASDRYKLTVGERTMRLGEEAFLESIEVRYNQPALFRFSTPKSNTSIRLNQPVVLAVDGVDRFRGTVRDSIPDPKLASRNQFAAVDVVDKTYDVQVATPRMALGGAKGYAAAKLVTFFFGQGRISLEEFLEAVTVAMGDELFELGGVVASATGIFDLLTGGDVPRFSLSDGGFPDLLNALCQSVPGLAWIYSPSDKLFRIVNVFHGDVLNITVPTSTVSDISLTHSLEGRYSRVKLVGSQYTISAPASLLLIPDWDVSLEPDWTIEDFTALADDTNAGSEISQEKRAVFRRYRFDIDNLLIDTESPIAVMQKVYKIDPDTAAYKWMSVSISDVNFTTKRLWTVYPCLRGPFTRRWVQKNARIPGKSKRAFALAMRYSTMATVGAPTASAGPGGTAFLQYGLDRTMVLRDYNNQEVKESTAERILESVCDVAIGGSVPIAGPVPDDLWELNRRINVRATGSSTGLENMQAIISGFTHEFAGGEKTTIELSTDRSAFAGRSV